MSDDLVKMARAAMADERLSDGALYGKLADRIEALEATLLATCKREAATQARHDAKVAALEAERDALAEKLAKAVEALREAETALDAAEGESKRLREALMRIQHENQQQDENEYWKTRDGYWAAIARAALQENPDG